MKYFKLLILTLAILMVSCETSEIVVDPVRPSSPIILDIIPSEDNHLMNLLPNIANGHINGRTLGTDIGEIDLNRGVKVFQPADTLTRYSLYFIDNNGLYFENLIVSEKNGKVFSYIMKYTVDFDWLIDQTNKVNVNAFTGTVAVSGLNRVVVAEAKLRNGISYSIEYNKITNTSGRKTDCDGPGGGGTVGGGGGGGIEGESNGSGDTGGGDGESSGSNTGGGSSGGGTSGDGSNGGSAGGGCIWYIENGGVIIDCPVLIPDTGEDFARVNCESVPYEDEGPIGVVTPNNTLLPVKIRMDSIYNKIEDPCMRKMVVKAVYENLDNQISHIINQVFEKSETIDLSFYEVTDLPNTTLAETNIGPVTVGDFTRIQADIFLNANVLPNASQEIIVSTIFHEVLHAYLGYSRSSTLFNDHEEMANEYINLMMGALQNLFPNISDKDAEALSFGGLHETSVWQNLVNNNPGKANEINQINKDHADGNKGTDCL